MITLETLALFLAADAVVKLSPGPDMALVVSRAATQGARAGMWSALGVGAAGLVQVPALMLGVAGVVAASPGLFVALKIAGALYLAWLGVRTLLGGAAGSPAGRARLHGEAFRQGFVTNLLSPKVVVFLLAFLLQFVDPAAGPAWAQFLVLGTVMKLNGVAFLSLVALAADRTGRAMGGGALHGRLGRTAFGASLLALSGFVLTSAFERGR